MERTSNIIGDFLDINKEISMIKINGKMEFIDNIRCKYYRNKLIKKTEKLSKANIPLSKDNILELLTHIYSNYMPTGKFGYITSTTYYGNSNCYVAAIALGNCSYSLKVSNETEKFTISIISTGKRENKGFTVELNELHSNNREIEDLIRPLNKALVDTMVDYILDTLKSYDGEVNEV